MDWVWNHSRSKGVGRMVMLALADKALPSETECKAYGSLTFLQRRANCTREAVTAALPVLQQLGELEVVEGEKGPYGASTYRLPKAIGHVRPRPVERPSNRSAHPTDSDSAIGRLTRPGVVGSPDQSGGQSVGSPDPITTSPPGTTTSAPADPPAPADTEGGGGGDQQQNAEAFLQSLPEPWAAGPVDARKLAPKLMEAIHAQGWDLDGALAIELTKNPGKIVSFPAVLPGRIANLAKRPSARTRASPLVVDLPPWCKDPDCNPTDRYRTTEDAQGFRTAERCPACHPDAKDRAA
jgi:hypothetical protein